MKSPHKLHPSQRLLLEVIKSSWEFTGRSPSRRELAKVLHVKSVNSVTYHLQALERGGYLEFDKSGRPVPPDIKALPSAVTMQLRKWRKDGLTLHQIVREWRRL